MKPTPPHDPLDELLAAALHGELTAAQRAELDTLLQNDPAARAAYQETHAMHDLLERNHRDAQPDAAFEDRLISRVREKTRAARQRETPWESVVFLWRVVKRPFVARPIWALAAVVACLGIVEFIYQDQLARRPFAMINPKLALAQSLGHTAGKEFNSAFEPGPVNLAAAGTAKAIVPAAPAASPAVAMDQSAVPPNAPAAAPAMASPATPPDSDVNAVPATIPAQDFVRPEHAPTTSSSASLQRPMAAFSVSMPDHPAALQTQVNEQAQASQARLSSIQSTVSSWKSETNLAEKAVSPAGSSASDQHLPVAAQPSRKLVRDAQLDLEVKSYQPTVDAVTALAKADGGYLDSSNSQRGGNGKLQGTMVVKVLPENLDSFLIKLRALGEVKNQSVSTEDVTKDYYDTQARLDNSRRMEAQLQQLLARDNGKVSDLLAVEGELGRVRGEIEQMQGQLKLYDFQVQYATVTINVAEKDLHQAAAYLLKENDQFSLFTGDVENAFAQAKAAAEAFKAEILRANLQHDSDNTLSATLAFSVPPEQIDGFLARVKSLGRVDNFTRQTQRVANDGGDPGDPSDQTRTEKDHVQVQLTIRADDESPRQTTQLTVASTGDIDAQAQALKDSAAASGATVIASNFERATDGTETATLSFRLPLAQATRLMPELQKLGRIESLAVQRDDRPGQAAADPGAPAEIDLRLHNVPAVRFEDLPPRQQSQVAIASGGDVDAQSRDLKSDALQAGYSLTASTFTRSPDGTEQAAMTFRLPLAQAAAFTARLEKLGRLESLAVQRNDVTGPDSIDPNAPAEISLDLHSEPVLVADDHGFWATVRNTLGGAVAAFFGSVQAIGILVAYIVPWALALVALAWGARRVYVVALARRSVP